MKIALPLLAFLIWLFYSFILLGPSYRIDDIDNITEIDRRPKIHPDYTDIVLPPNLAPLNFSI